MRLPLNRKIAYLHNRVANLQLYKRQGIDLAVNLSDIEIALPTVFLGKTFQLNAVGSICRNSLHKNILPVVVRHVPYSATDGYPLLGHVAKAINHLERKVLC